MAEHAPAPWEVQKTNRCGIREFILDSCDGNYIGAISADEFDDETTEANAHLASAAPELLSALRQFVRMDDNREEVSGGAWNAAVVMARAAIVKATGQEVPSC